MTFARLKQRSQARPGVVWRCGEGWKCHEDWGGDWKLDQLHIQSGWIHQDWINIVRRLRQSLVYEITEVSLQINNLWESSVKASLHIQWPKWNKDEKWLLYLVSVTSTGPQDIVCTPQSEINPLKYIQVVFQTHWPTAAKLHCFVSVWINGKKCPFRSRHHPGPNGNSARGKLSARRRYCRGKTKCWWVFVRMDLDL